MSHSHSFLLCICCSVIFPVSSPGHYSFVFVFFIYISFFIVISVLFIIILCAIVSNTTSFFPWHIDFHWYDDENKLTDWLSDYSWWEKGEKETESHHTLEPTTKELLRLYVAKKRSKYDANYWNLVAWPNGVGNSNLHMVHCIACDFCSRTLKLLVVLVVVVLLLLWCLLRSQRHENFSWANTIEIIQ